MRKILIMFLSAFATGAILAAPLIEEWPEDGCLQFEFDEYKNYTHRAIVITKSGTMFVLSGDKDPDEKTISTDEISAFWEAAKEFINTFKFERRNISPKKSLLSVSVSSGSLGDLILIRKRIGNIEAESNLIKRIISLCNRYLPEECKIK